MSDQLEAAFHIAPLRTWQLHRTIKEYVADRDRAIYEARKAGFKFRDIGPQYGVSYERARQICKKMENRELRKVGEKRKRHFIWMIQREDGKLGRPIDTGGGPRDQWITWPPQGQAREFKRA